MSDFEQCSNQLQLDLITLLVNFSYQVGTMMSRYAFLEARPVILSNVRTDHAGHYFGMCCHLEFHNDHSCVWTDICFAYNLV